jgi:hypothetical protein
MLVGCTTGVQSGTGARIFHSATASKSALRSIRLPGQWEPGLFARVQRPERETDHSFASNAGVECVELHLHSPIRLHVYFRTVAIYLSNKIIKNNNGFISVFMTENAVHTLRLILVFSWLCVVILWMWYTYWESMITGWNNAFLVMSVVNSYLPYVWTRSSTLHMLLTEEADKIFSTCKHMLETRIASLSLV